MRNIKFRAWNIRDGKWIHPDLFIMTNAGFYADYRAFEDGCSLFDYEYELMQYTGLFDDNGKRIYEGDIVEFVDGKRKHISEVIIHPIGVYVEAHPVIKEITGKGIEMLYDYSDYGNGRGITQRCYVLGNIYENPELIKN